MKKLFILPLFVCGLMLGKASANTTQQAAPTDSIAQKIKALESRLAQQQKQINELKSENEKLSKQVSAIEATKPVAVSKKYVVTRTGSKQVVAVN